MFNLKNLANALRKRRVGNRRGARRRERSLSLEPLSPRLTPAVNAFFTASTGVLAVVGDAADNNISIARNAAGSLIVNGGAVAISGGAPTVANTSEIRVFAQAGNDRVFFNEANGALPRATLFGGLGNDTLIGGSGADMLFGQAGNDQLFGRGGDDFLFGGADNDQLSGGADNDQMLGQSGNDRLIVNPGDGTDLLEGGDGSDTVETNGSNASESFSVVPNGTRVRLDRIAPAPYASDIGSTENLVVNLNGGNDSFVAINGLGALIQITVDGGAGSDTLLGGDGADLLLGGDGNDFISGGRGNDIALLGAGNDTFQWDPGDGSDTVEGQDGIDRLLFNGSNVAEIIDISANGQRVRFSRNIAAITMDLNEVERIDFNALGGADNVVVNDVSGTDLREVNIDLAASLGSSLGDAQPDTVTVFGTNGADSISIATESGRTVTRGLAAVVRVANAEPALDQLVVNALAGDDVVDAGELAANTISLVVNGGADDDVLLGSDGNDTLLGGDGDDVLIGGLGTDILDGGAGDNVVIQ